MPGQSGSDRQAPRRPQRQGSGGYRKRKIKHLKVVYSKEPAMTPIEDDSISCKNHCICPPGTQRKCTVRRAVPGSNAFVPSVAGLIIGGEVVKDLVGFVPLKG